MEAIVKEALKTEQFKKIRICSGCINEGASYQTDTGIVMVKKNMTNTARQMFDSEFESLKVLKKTKYFRVPEPLLVVDIPKEGAAIVMEFIEFTSLSHKVKEMGLNLAKLHLHNIKLEEKSTRLDQFVGSSMEEISENTYVPKFGFPITTFCGSLTQNNSWCDDWVTFYGRKLQGHMDKLEQEYGDREALELWSSLKVKLPQFFKGLDIKPSLLHGDLWGENCGETQDETVIFDPASFYGHHEYELAMADFCGSGPFRKPFWDSYHSLIPRAEGWTARHKLYLLYHYVNHWLIFGSGYKRTVLHSLRELVKEPIQ